MKKNTSDQHSDERFIWH